MDQATYQLNNFKELVGKVVKAKAKAGLQPSLYICKTDYSCLQESRPAHTLTSKVHTLVSSMKESCIKEPTEKAFAFHFKQLKSSEKVQKEKKKKWQKDR